MHSEVSKRDRPYGLVRPPWGSHRGGRLEDRHDHHDRDHCLARTGGGNTELIRDQQYLTNPDAGLRQMTNGKNADAGITFTPTFRHILIIFQQ